jgi:ribosomal protein S18 acetylase RimI-like enzyme
MRRGEADDFARVIEIEAAAFGDLADGEAATAARLADAAWIGLLERDGQVVAYAITDEVQGAQGRIISAAVDPPSWGNGFGSLVLGAAVYRLVANEARRITMRVRPEILQALRVTQDLGFKPGTRGIEWRRPVDERLIEERREQARVAGVKARFGDWR